MNRFAVLAAVALVLGGLGTAWAQVPGDRVRVETESGVVEGLLVDRLPQGYLLNLGTQTQVVLYVHVRGITRVDPAQPAVAVPAVPTPEGPAVPAVPTASEAPAEPPPPLVLDVPSPPMAPETAPLVVPAAALPEPPQAIETRRRSKALMGVGIAMTAVGALGALVGGGAYLSNLSNQSNDGMETGMVLTGAGLAVLATGVTLWAIGGEKVPVERAQAPSLVPAVAVGPTSAAATWRF